jgi:hypothetical protein
MRLSNLSIICLVFALVIGCGKSDSSNIQTSSDSTNNGSGNNNNPPSSTPVSGDNVLAITVNGSLCSQATSAYYINKPCVSVTVCTPGATMCRTVDDILLDTGSYGLRIFKSVLTGVTLSQITSGANSVAECVSFADGSTDWGPVMMADVILGNEPAVQIPIQVIDSTFGKVPGACGTPDASPTIAGFNGILGVGLFTEDCGSYCANNANNGMYYVCSGTTCADSTVALSDQVQNPVAHLPLDNNGVLVQLPSVPLGGSTSVNGSLILGVGTRSNNTPSGITTYNADSQYGEFITLFNGTTYSQSFIDSGSNALAFPTPPTITPCTGPDAGWFCPSSTTSLSATNKGYSGSPSGDVSFQIGNADSLFNSSNMVFVEIGAFMPGQSFDWGLPFFFGRNVYVGIDGKTSGIGTGPYWAY